MPSFERSRAGITMTLAGSAFIRGAKPMLATADKLVAMMRAAGQGVACQSLRIGPATVLTPLLLPTALSASL
jgi:DNA-binding transcriptional LysR family regulator